MLAGFQKYREAILLALIIFLCQAVLAVGLSEYAAYDALRRDSLATQQMLQSVYNDGSANAAQPAAGPLDFQAFGKRVTALPGIVRANIYSADRFIRFSSDHNLTGKKFLDNSELEEAFANEIIASVELVDGTIKSEHLALGSLSGVTSHLIEAYIPLRNSTGNVEAVVEYYKKPDELKASTGNFTRIIWFATAVAGAAILLLVLGLSAFLRKT